MRVTERGPAGERCPYCRDALRALPAVHCPGCGVGVHEECRRALEGCPTVGCKEQPARRTTLVTVEQAPALAPYQPSLQERISDALARGIVWSVALLVAAVVLGLFGGVTYVGTRRVDPQLALALAALVSGPVALLGVQLVKRLARRLGVEDVLGS